MNRILLVTLLAATATATPVAARPRNDMRRVGAAGATVCQGTPSLAYSGGPLIQHVKVVDVFWSPNYKYKAMLESFYKAILQSAYIDWLIEYNTTSYKIGRGSFVTSFEDVNPAPAATATIKQVNPETYLKSLLAASKLPPPDDDTMYMLYFPDRIDPTDGQGSSCVNAQNGQYCAYHASYTDGAGQLVRYGVMPDMDAAGCSMGCGPPGFLSVTDVSSHELIEAVTDPDNGTGWYDPNPNQMTNCGEIGDICATGGAQEVGVVAGFTVQKEWSNKANACIVVDPNLMISDFSVAVDPLTVSVPAGGMATATVTLTKKSGTTEPVTLSAIMVPTGLAAAFSSTSVMSDAGTSTLTVSAAPTLAPGTTLSFEVKAAGAVVTQTATVNVTVVDAPDMAMPAGGGGNGDKGGGCSVAGSAADPSLALVLLLAVAGALALRRRHA